MTYLVADDMPQEPAGLRFRRLVERAGIFQLPGAYNGLSALQAKAAGFDGLYLSGAAMSAQMGLPDLGVLTIEDVCFFIRQVARGSGLPVLVDGDTGFGEALNVMHMVRMFEEAGAGAVQIEDQILPKKCGHLNDKKLASADDMAAKVAAARKARKNLVIIARTDAAASEGIDGAVAIEVAMSSGQQLSRDGLGTIHKSPRGAGDLIDGKVLVERRAGELASGRQHLERGARGRQGAACRANARETVERGHSADD